MKFILADTEIQLIPQIILNDNEFKANNLLQNDHKVRLLNYPIHKKYIKKYFPEMAQRMGRLYIPYMFARMTEESIINNYYEIDYAIHTKEGFIIEKEELLHIQSYEEFIERIERIISSKDKIVSLNKYIETLGNKEIYVFHPDGKKSMNVSPDSILIIGGFAEGDYISDLSHFERIRVFREEITVPSAIEIIHFSIISSIGLPYIHFSSL